MKESQISWNKHMSNRGRMILSESERENERQSGNRSLRGRLRNKRRREPQYFYLRFSRSIGNGKVVHSKLALQSSNLAPGLPVMHGNGTKGQIQDPKKMMTPRFEHDCSSHFSIALPQHQVRIGEW